MLGRAAFAPQEGCLIQNRDAFSGYHPAVNFLYFGLVLVFTMFFMSSSLKNADAAQLPTD